MGTDHTRDAALDEAQRILRASSVKRVYLAGKIGHNDWRHRLFPELRSVLAYRTLWGEAVTEQTRPRQDGFELVGPFFIGCDHGGFHGRGTHGVGADNDVRCGCQGSAQSSRQDVLIRCLDWLRAADVVFCWLDSADAYGTIFELGVASALQIPVFLAYSEDAYYSDRIEALWRDSWLARTAARRAIRVATPEEAWSLFRRWCHA